MIDDNAEEKILAEDKKAILAAIAAFERDLEEAQQEMRETGEIEWILVHPKIAARVLSKAKDAIRLEELYAFEA